ncbi:MAG: DUF2335 domain-containing protein [Rickettsiaceae bacterium]|nr:MAG: DUF2335 domain-containing protein [Rickettsiaceae bacterium]
MKENKQFFGKDISLNKGYIDTDHRRDNGENYQKRFAHVLPPIDLITEFEDIYPGTLARIIEMSENEQRHSHAVAMENNKSQNNNIKFGKICSVVIVAIICATTILLAIMKESQTAGFFSVAAFTFLIIPYFISQNRSLKKSSPITVDKPKENTKHRIHFNNNFKNRRKIK